MSTQAGKSGASKYFKELASNQKAQSSVQTEYQKLRRWPVWNEDDVEEYQDVVDRYEAACLEVHFGRIFATCTQKNAELDVPEESADYEQPKTDDDDANMETQQLEQEITDAQDAMTDPAATPVILLVAIPLV